MIWAISGNFPIVTPVTCQIATPTTDRNGFDIGFKIQQPLIHRILSHYGYLTVIPCVKDAIQVHSGQADSTLMILKNTMIRTEKTHDSAVFQGFPERCLFHPNHSFFLLIMETITARMTAVPFVMNWK